MSQRLGPGFFESVQGGLRAQLAASGLNAILTDSPEDVAYLTGFFHHPGERPVAVWLDDQGRIVLLLPELERENAERQRAHAELVAFPEYPGVVPPFEVLARALGAVGAASVGHAPSISWERLDAARAALPSARFAASALVTRARFLKHPDEIALHEEAARITDRMIAAGIQLVRERVASGGELPSEAELASHVTSTGVRAMYDEHDDVVVVSPLAGALVYTGANSAYPHGLPSGQRLQPGDTFMLSLGCAVGGRFVEGERTFVVGEPSAEQRRYHDAVRAAQAEGMRAIAPGVECRRSNQRCLDVIRDAGLGEFLRHRQGHGIGLGMHEPPWLEDGDPTPLEAGMIVSNEPGIYVPGHAGYRISDSMLVTAEGSRPLTSFPRGLDDCVIEL
ncbi:MAG TPA: Xaa-Pro peptidase family protein [Gryllotalpicola sp.]